MATDKKDRYSSITRRAGLLCSVSVIFIAAFGAGSEFINQVAPWLLNLVMPLSMLAALVAAVTCVAAEISPRFNSRTEAVPESSRQTLQALWFLAGFVGVSLLAAIFDDRIQAMPSICGIGRVAGPLAALLGSILSLLLGFRFKDVRFSATGIPSIGLMIYWIWRFIHR